MSLLEVSQAFDKSMAEFLMQNSRTMSLIHKFADAKTPEEHKQLEDMAVKCYSNMVVAMEEVNFWTKRMADYLESK